MTFTLTFELREEEWETLKPENILHEFAIFGGNSKTSRPGKYSWWKRVGTVLSQICFCSPSGVGQKNKKEPALAIQITDIKLDVSREQISTNKGKTHQINARFIDRPKARTVLKNTLDCVVNGPFRRLLARRPGKSGDVYDFPFSKR